MTIQLYNTLTRQKEPLETRVPGRVHMYVCGPTVYDDCHIGHLMGPVLFDAIARWLRARGLEVRFVINITDIDDKIIQRANENGEGWQDVAERYTQQYFDFMRELHVETVTDHPRCTEYVPQMVAFVGELIAAGRAYVADDGVYYEVGKQDGYGKLSGRKVEDMLAGARVEHSASLRHPADFALWKLAKPGEPTWDSPWGPGRPGWHLECSVMSTALLGREFDVHGGGDDLKFPHHENEIAQSEAHGDRYARYWMHNGLIQYGGKKVAKSDPRMREPGFARQFQARWLIDTHGAATIRFFLLRGHYRRPIDFEPSNLEATGRALSRLHEQLGALLDEPGDVTLDQILGRELDADLRRHVDRFGAAMDDDFNSGEAIAELFGIAKLAQRRDGAGREQALVLLRDLGRLLGLFEPGDRRAAAGVDDSLAGELVGLLIELRQAARASKDFATSDRIRDRLGELGIALKDGPEGTTWSRS